MRVVRSNCLTKKVTAALWLPHYEAEYGALVPDAKSGLLAATASTLDRLLSLSASNTPSVPRGAFAVNWVIASMGWAILKFVLIVFQVNCLTLIPLVCYSLISRRGVEQSGSSSGS